MSVNSSYETAVSDVTPDSRTTAGSYSQQFPAIITSSSVEEDSETAEIENRRPASLLSRAWMVFEVVVAAIALLLCAPLILLIAAVIRRGTPGPALFFQKRIGMNRRPFTFVKFRTFYVDARARFPELYAYRHSPSRLKDLRFKEKNDPRITPQGGWLRLSTLDELPNFWCVIKGEMALVGPRPEIPEMLPYYQGEMLRKFTVRPGITGLAQISGRGRLSFYETVAYDLEYVRRRSVALDIEILIKTIYKVITRDGAF